MTVVDREPVVEDAPTEIGRAAPRSIIAGRYEINREAPLGEGGMAVVYRGRDLRTRRTVALKTLRGEFRDDPEARARFRREARAMAFAAHPNVARVFDLIEDAAEPWVVLEYVPGQTLKELVTERGALPSEEVGELLDQVADALAHLHQRGLVHLDVKPQNLIVDPDGVVKLIDFGLAQDAGTAQEMIGGTTFGTVAYLAPEQARGDTVEAATDVYALGCVMYELLTGSPPFLPHERGQTKQAVIEMHLAREPVPPTRARPDLALPRWVDRVVLRALAKDPAHRYRDVRSLTRVFRAGLFSGTTRDVSLGEDASDTVPVTVPLAVDDRPSPARRVAESAYRVGGRTVRRGRRMRRGLWRLTAALALGNLMLALVLFGSREASGLLARHATLHPGGSARVVIDRLRLRDGPSTESAAIAAVDAGDRVVVTGHPEPVDGDLWWPVRADSNGESVSGYVWGEGIEPVGPETPREWARELRLRSGELVGGVRDRWESVSHVVS